MMEEMMFESLGAVALQTKRFGCKRMSQSKRDQYLHPRFVYIAAAHYKYGSVVPTTLQMLDKDLSSTRILCTPDFSILSHCVFPKYLRAVTETMDTSLWCLMALQGAALPNPQPLVS